MSAHQSKHIPLSVDMDSDELRLPATKASFMKGLTMEVGTNAGSAISEGSNSEVLKPVEGNKLIAHPAFPGGDSYCIGCRESPDTNEIYVFCYNSAQTHFIYRIRGNDNTVQIVYKSSLLRFRLDPKNFISEGRCVIRTVEYFNKASQKTETRTYVVFTDNSEDVHMICAEDSIATDSFNYVTFPFFQPAWLSGGRYPEVLEMYNKLGMPPPLGCVVIQEGGVSEGDELRQNLLIDKGWQFRIKFIDIYGRESEHGMISDRYFVVTGNSCISTSSGLARCLTLIFDAGNAFVDKIQVEFRNCSVNVENLSVDSGWFIYDIVDKYDNSSSVNWWQRSLNSALTYVVDDNTFVYNFCGDKMCEPIDALETSRLFNPMPLASSSVMPLDQGVGLTNNLRGFEPITPAQIAKVTYDVIEPGDELCDDFATRKITVYAMIHRRTDYLNSDIHIDNGRVFQDGTTHRYYYHMTSLASDILERAIQTFRPGFTGFIGYLAGTRYVTISSEVVIYGDDLSETDVASVDTGRPYLYVQKFEFVVLPGRYIFRIASPTSSTSEDYQKTSAYVVATGHVETTLTDIYYPTNSWGGNIIKEKIVDVCTDDFRDAENVLIILDMYKPITGSVHILAGYIHESEESKVAVELAPVSQHPSFLATHLHTGYTDHNGFFWATSSGTSEKVRVYVEDCVNNHYVDLDNNDDTSGTAGSSVLKQLYSYSGAFTYPALGRRLITGRILLCDSTDVGIPGVPVIMANGGWVLTDNNGYFTIIGHARLGAWATVDDVIYLSQGGVCQVVSCDDCVMCFPGQIVEYKNCAATPDRNLDLGITNAYVRGLNQKGPQSGGRYELGFAAHDGLGRCTFIQADASSHVDIPHQIITKKFYFSRIGYTIDPTMVLPSWVRFISFWISKNQNFDDFITWAVDKVEYVDGTGAPVANPTKIRLYYESLSEYDSQNNFSVNTSWQFIDSVTDHAIVGDRIEFLQKPDGSWFDKLISPLVRYDKTGKFVEIDYDSSLLGLEDGTLVRIIRPKQCEFNNLYFELCPAIQVVNGVPQGSLTGVFNYADSYYINRTIPVPVYTGDDPVERTVVPHAYTYFFEHHSPSDFWGDHCRTLGRVNVKNPFEKQRRLKSETALSKPLLSKSNFNGLSYFDSADTITFDEHEWGEILVGLPENNVVLFICAHDNFVVGFNDTQARVNAEGVVVAPSAPKRFGAPERKVGQNYGCQMSDINTIQKWNGVVVFLDRSREQIVFHTYAQAKTEPGTGFRSWLRRKIMWMRDQEKDVSGVHVPGVNQYYFLGGVDPKAGEYLFTRFLIPNYQENVLGAAPVSSASYISNLGVPDITGTETIAIDMKSQEFRGHRNFCGEYYGTLTGSLTGKTYFAFRHAEPWSQHSGDLTVAYLNYFGTQTRKYLQIVTNVSPDSVKRFLCIAVNCKEHAFIASAVKTESGQTSRIKIGHWEKRENFWVAPFLCATNTPVDPTLGLQTTSNALLDGETLYGRWIKVTLESEAADDAKYCEISAVLVFLIKSEKSGD